MDRSPTGPIQSDRQSLLSRVSGHVVFGRLPETHPRRIGCLGCTSHGYAPPGSSTDLARPAPSHEGCSVRQLRSGALDWPFNWTGDCSWSPFYGFRRIKGSPVVSRAFRSCRSGLRIVHVVSPPKGTGGQLITQLRITRSR